MYCETNAPHVWGGAVRDVLNFRNSVYTPVNSVYAPLNIVYPLLTPPPASAKTMHFFSSDKLTSDV